jgi:chorismate synthase
MREHVSASSLFCPDAAREAEMCALLTEVELAGDSLGGVVAFRALNVPAGLGDPVYAKLEARLAHAMMSLPAAKGFEIGSGFDSATLRGSEYNDLFVQEEGRVRMRTNHAGGTLGGISTGMPVTGRVVFKPASSIRIPQPTLSLTGETALWELPAGSRHDPCVAIRAVPVVEAMLAIVLVDALLMHRSARL